MSNTLQEFLTVATQKAADELAAAFLRIPEDKRQWNPEGKSRSAFDQMAECALLNGLTADMIHTRKWSVDNYDEYVNAKNEAVAAGWDRLNTLLQENTRRVIEAIRTVAEGDLAVEIETPWNKQTLAEFCAYSYWNMTYHMGQINYIASLLDSKE